MNAQDARIKAEEVLTNSTNSQFSKIMVSIEEAAAQGKLECYIYDQNISQAVRDKLIKLGYTVGKTEGGGPRDESLTKIEW